MDGPRDRGSRPKFYTFHFTLCILHSSGVLTEMSVNPDPKTQDPRPKPQDLSPTSYHPPRPELEWTHDRHHRLRHGQPSQRAEGIRESRPSGHGHQRSGRGADGREGGSAGRGGLRGRHGRTAPARPGAGRCWRPSTPASRSWASAWACNCCSTWATKTAATKAWGCSAARWCGSSCPHEYSVPHMGWNQLQFRRRAPCWRGWRTARYVYFVHSYYVVPRGPRGDRHADRLRPAVLLDDLARQLYRHAIPPGKEPGRRPADAPQFCGTEGVTPGRQAEDSPQRAQRIAEGKRSEGKGITKARRDESPKNLRFEI